MNLDRLPRWALPVALAIILAGGLAWGTAAHGTTPPILTRDCPAPQNATTAVVHLEIGGLTSNYFTSIVTVNGVLFGWLSNDGSTAHFSHGMNAATTHFVVQVGTYDQDGTPNFSDGQWHERVEIDLPIPPECAPPATTTATTQPATTAPETSVFVCTDGSVDCAATTTTSTPSTSGAGATTSTPAGGPPQTLPHTGRTMTPFYAAGLAALALGTLAVIGTRRRVTS